MDFNLRDGVLDLTEVVSRQLDIGATDVLLKPTAFRGSWDWNDPRLLGKQPPKRDLRWRCLLALGTRLQPRNKGEVRAPVLLRKSWNSISEVGRVEGGGVVDLTRQEPFTEGAEWDEADAKFLERSRICCSGSRHHSEYSLWRAATG